MDIDVAKENAVHYSQARHTYSQSGTVQYSVVGSFEAQIQLAEGDTFRNTARYSVPQ